MKFPSLKVLVAARTIKLKATKDSQKTIKIFYSVANLQSKLNSDTFFSVESHTMDVKGNFPVAKGHLERFSSYLFRRKLGRKHNQNIVQNQNKLKKNSTCLRYRTAMLPKLQPSAELDVVSMILSITNAH